MHIDHVLPHFCMYEIIQSEDHMTIIDSEKEAGNLDTLNHSTAVTPSMTRPFLSYIFHIFYEGASRVFLLHATVKPRTARYRQS